MDTTEKTDRDLLLAFINGDETAFNELYCRFSRDVRHVVFKYHKPSFHFEIEDICQHFWTGLLQYAHSYDRSKPVRNWLISAAVKSVSSYARKQRPLSLVSLDSPDHHEQSPVAQAIINEEATVVFEAMKKLPAAYQRIIHAVYLKGQSLADYSATSGVNINTVHGQIKRAMKCLRELPEVRSLV